MRPPRISDYALSGQRLERLFRAGVGATWDGEYLHWDELRERQPPAGIAPHEWWIGTKLVRRAVAAPVGRFTVATVGPLLAGLHVIDRPALPTAAPRLAVDAMIEEAVASAQLAGAEIGQAAGKRLLRDRRRPHGPDEELICDTFALLERAEKPDAPADDCVHPAIRAIVAHLAAADRRRGRAAFYAAMRAAGYDHVALLSISTAIRRDPDGYERAIAHVASDDDDATYFVLHQLGVIARAVDDARRALDRAARSADEARALAPGFNDRQAALLRHARAHPDARYTIEAHRASHDVVYETARADLRELEQAKLLRKHKAGRAFAYTPAPDLSARLARR